jgi:hypothetical protein
MSVGITGTIEQRWQQLESALKRLGVVDEKTQLGTCSGEALKKA